jgi:hypothetical protein
MTREQKLAFHLEMVIWEDAPEGTRMNAAEVERLVQVATEEQRRRAYERALTRSPLLLEDDDILARFDRYDVLVGRATGARTNYRRTPRAILRRNHVIRPGNNPGLV